MNLSEDIKNQLKQALADTDWTQLPDVDLANKAEFTNYRFQLRAYLRYAPPYAIVPPAPEPVWSTPTQAE
jgi:hypothetical protein